jgi:enterochelin esterase-like enzyme
VIAVVAVVLLCIGLHAASKPGFAAQAKRCPDRSHYIESLLLFAPSLDRSKRLFVYLPSGYECADDRRFPVFYLNDGHDLFDWNLPPAELDPTFTAELSRREAWYGSWQLASQLEEAAKAGRLPPMIIVGIAADDGFRSSDLAPLPWRGSIEGSGVDYGDFIASVVVPAIDHRFRTIRDRRCRGIGGASLGGVSALQIGLNHSSLFGMVMSLSPVLADPAFADYVKKALAAFHHGASLNLLIDFDDDPRSAADQVWLQSLSSSMSAAGLRIILTRTPGERHRIASWAKRVIPALTQLFDAQCS